ncbi:hypothetical protein F2Q69_00017323 [Brassica cretica]|uniref:Uncharacterized protein n=1 Tax=Brassica cretica TaxID=69181 RepID=A0A8S9R7T0_BRACR|nr:hypothetical protein F2Q69_00017323 [Brassica cretica]
MAATKMVFHHKNTSKRLPGSLLTGSSPMSQFHNRYERFGFSDMGLIYMFFRSGSDFGRPMRSLLESLLKYNALEDFQKVFKKTSFGSLPEDFKEVFQTTSWKSSDGVFFHIK